jgi:hypothetical protein
LYDKEKIANNKTAYKIADSNVKNIVIPLLKTDPRDSFIIDHYSDINNISNLQRILEKEESNQYNSANLIYDILKNPRPYMDIIKYQYMYMPDITDIAQYYTYYGKTDMKDYEITDLENNFLKYCLANHDDYDYQQELYFLSRAYTGYDDFILEDQSLTFYIIHPDENVIKRNLLTGKMIGLKCNPSVTDAYYYYLLNANNIDTNMEDIKKCNFGNVNYKNFHLLKYSLAIDDAKLQLLVIDLPTTKSDTYIKYTDIKDPIISKYVNYYFINLPESGDRIITIKSNILSQLQEIQLLTSLTILNDVNYLLWYAFSIPYGIENEVLALISLITTVPDLSQWIGTVKSKNDITKFFSMHLSEKSDIYFLWKLWNDIKEILIKQNLFEITQIDVGLESQFRNNKELFWRGSKIPFDQFLIFDKMYKSGKLNVENEFYNYISQLTIDFSEIVKTKDIGKYVDIIAKNNLLNSEKLQDFVVDYFNILFTVNKKKWMYDYEIENKLIDVPEKMDVIEWAKNKLSLPGIINNPNYTPTTWDKIFETYVRAFSINLMKNEVYYYLRINKGVRVDPVYWAKRLILEKTFLNNKMDYLIYHTTDISGDSIGASYLTPVKLEWVMELNPVYYYYLLFDKNNSLYLMKDNEDIVRSVNIINSIRKQFSFKALISFLDQIDNPVVSGIIRNQLYDQKI